MRVVLAHVVLLIALIAGAVVLLLSEAWIVEQLMVHLDITTAIVLVVALSCLVAAALLVVCLVLYRLRRSQSSNVAGSMSLLAGVAFVIQASHAGSLILSSKDIENAYRGALEQGSASVSLHDAGHVVVFGPIGLGLLNDILEYDQPGAAIAEISITSEGGTVDEALKIASWVEARSITVSVEDYCHSACVLVAVASPRSRADENAIFGLHRMSLYHEPQSEVAQTWKADSDLVSREFLESHGVPESILSKADQYEGDEIYELTAREMVEAGAISQLISNGEVIATAPRSNR